LYHWAMLGKPKWAELSLRKMHAAILLLATLVFFDPGAPARNDETREHWVGSWSTSQQLVEPDNSLAPDDLRDATFVSGWEGNPPSFF
jgi:adenosyl cobinamide kinase/adenosyl cobinamide phosphate guanylyltransferase